MALRFGTDKDVKKLIRQAQKQGWQVGYDGGQHIRVVPTGGQPFSIPLTPGSKQGIRRTKSLFRKAGLTV